MERYPEDNPIEKLFNAPGQDGQLQRAQEMINDSGIIQDCNAVIRKYCGTASGALDILPDCPARHSLLELASYISDRNH